jgi:hypothetical protein
VCAGRASSSDLNSPKDVPPKEKKKIKVMQKEDMFCFITSSPLENSILDTL